MFTDRLNLENFPTSPYAQALRWGIEDLRFDTALESEYRDEHLTRMRLRAKLWYTVNLALALLFTFETVGLAGLKTPLSLVQLGVFLPTAAVLAWLVWGPNYEDFFLRGSRWLGPLASALTAAGVILMQAPQAQAAGFLELELMGTFFFSGLLFKDALIAACLFLLSFALTAAVLTPALSHVSLLTVGALTLAMAALIYRDAERTQRRAFLENSLVNELVALDGLTGLANRRAFDEHIMKVWQHALREERGIAVLMIDIDHFKQFNDTHGHQAGDLALRRVAQVVQGFARRPLDLAARYGGEELAIILYDPPRSEVKELAERLRLSVQGLKQAAQDSATSKVTVSIGAALVQPTGRRSALGAVQLADEALYEAKNHTRNCVVLKDIEAYQHLRTGAFKSSKPAKPASAVASVTRIR